MKKLPVFQITKDAYKFIFTDAKKILPLFVQYSTSIILLYVFLHLVKNQFIFSSAEMSEKFFPVAIFTFTILALWLQLPMNISVVRTIVRQEKIGKDYFKSILTVRTSKAFLTILITSLLLFMAAAGITVLIGGLIFAFWSLNLQEGNFNILNIILIIFGLILFFHVALRLFLAVSSAALDNHQPIKFSWKVLKGCLIRLLAIVILTSLPGIIWSAIVSFLLNISFQSNPLAYGLLTLPQLYFGLALYAGLGLVYKHIEQ